LKEIQTAIETAIGTVVNSARAELGLTPIIPKAGFIGRWGKDELSDEDRARFREDQLKKLEEGLETQRQIRERAEGGDEEAIEWVAAELQRIEQGWETMRDICRRAAEGDEEAIQWVADELQLLGKAGKPSARSVNELKEETKRQSSGWNISNVVSMEGAERLPGKSSATSVNEPLQEEMKRQMSGWIISCQG
jgi:predicted NBD/HSP70 family sugar kinase